MTNETILEQKVFLEPGSLDLEMRINANPATGTEITLAYGGNRHALHVVPEVPRTLLAKALLQAAVTLGGEETVTTLMLDSLRNRCPGVDSCFEGAYS